VDFATTNGVGVGVPGYVASGMIILGPGEEKLIGDNASRENSRVIIINLPRDCHDKLRGVVLEAAGTEIGHEPGTYSARY
jgi:hypothetical protein